MSIICDEQTTPYVVYVAYDEDGTILYVGQTNDLSQRLHRHHCGYSPVYYLSHRIVIAYGAQDRSSARDIEAFLIERLQPKYNVQKPLRSMERYDRADLDALTERLKAGAA